LSETVIHVRELTKRFPQRRIWSDVFRSPSKLGWKEVLKGIDLEVRQGEILGLVGANGAGKTTLIRILSTLLLPTGGRAEIMGLDVVKSAQQVRHAVGWCLDTERSFYHRLTGLQNLSFFASLNNVPPNQIASRIRNVVEIVGLDDSASRPVRHYSRGMQQKLGLARALMTNPSILLLDEPTKSLDPAASRDFWRFIRGVLARDMRKTILIVTHNLQEARFCCDRVALMHEGHISALGPWREVKSQIRTHGFDEQVASGE